MEERITETTGVFSKTTDELELYRVKDLRLEQPFLLRLVKLSNIVLNTSDRTHSVVSIPAIAERRDLKGVKETDFE